MKIKMLIPIALVLCLAFSLCACGTTTNNNETTAPATTTAATTATAAETTAPADTQAATDSEGFSEEDAITLVQNTYDFSDEYFLHVRSTVEIDGTNYYGVDLRKSLETNTTYISTYFVKTDGSEIVEGYFEGEVPYLTKKETADFTEEDALELVENTYGTSDDCFYHVRGTVEVDGVSYYGVDVMKKIDVNVTYNGITYFVKADGSDIVEGYYWNNEPVFSSGEEKPAFEITEENAVKAVKAAYNFGDDEFLVLRGTEEIDGVNYYAVDLRRSFEDHSSYLSTFFVNEDGTKIIKGYYEGNTPVLTE